MSPLRVFHIPYLGPYIGKIASSHIEVVKKYGDTSIYMKRPLLQEELDAFDVLHLHYALRFGTVQGLKNLLEQCIDKQKRLVFTAHDLWPVRNYEYHHEKLHLACSLADAVITLTPGCAEKLVCMFRDINLATKLSVIPHGFAVHPFHPHWGFSGSQGRTLHYALYGHFRANRDLLGFARAWYAALKGENARLNILLRAPEISERQDPQLRIEETLAFLRSDPLQMRVVLTPSLDDEQIISFLSGNDILALPYCWGTHSGQLEMAFDLNILPLSSRVGFFAEQWLQVRPYVREPCWFDWQDLSPNNGHLQEILRDVQMSMREKRSPKLDCLWKSYRIWEHHEFIQAHHQIYAGAAIVNMSSIAGIKDKEANHC